MKHLTDEQFQNITNALQCVLLFYNGGYWNSQTVEKWTQLTGEKDATTRVICDTVRKCLDSIKDLSPKAD